MSLVQRVQNILLKPRETWQTIAQEPSDIPGLFKNYVVYLAAVSAVATFIGLSLVGVGGFGMSFRVPVVSGLVNMVIGFALTLVMVYVLGLIANALAPTFQGEKNLPNAVKLIAYGSTAGLLGGIFNLLPALSMLGLLAALYSIYLIYTGIPVMMKAPEGKAVGYTAVLIVCGIVAAMVVGAVSALFTGGGPGMMGQMGRSDGNVTIKVPGTDVTIDTAKLEEAARKMEEAGKKVEEAQARGDQAGTNKALGEMMGAALGGSGGKPLAPETLQRFVPEKLAGMTRESIEARADQAMGMSFSSVSAGYSKDGQGLEVQVQDIGAVPALTMAMGAWASSTVNRETKEEVERIYQKDGISFREEYSKDGSRSEMAMLLPNGVMLEIDGSDIGMDTVRAAAAALDIKGLAGLQRDK
ncbi:MAG: Yip1 family protein [Gammaproteobacteria bacterium]